MAILTFTQTSSLTPEFLPYYLAPLVVWGWMKSWETWLSSLPIPANKNNSHWFLNVEMIHFSLCMNPWSCKQPGIGAGEVLSLETSNVVFWLPQASQPCCDLECWWTSPEPASEVGYWLGSSLPHQWMRLAPCPDSCHQAVCFVVLWTPWVQRTGLPKAGKSGIWLAQRISHSYRYPPRYVNPAQPWQM